MEKLTCNKENQEKNDLEKVTLHQSFDVLDLLTNKRNINLNSSMFMLSVISQKGSDNILANDLVEHTRPSSLVVFFFS